MTSEDLGAFCAGFIAGAFIVTFLVVFSMANMEKTFYMNQAFENGCAHYDAKENGLVWNKVTP